MKKLSKKRLSLFIVLVVCIVLITSVVSLNDTAQEIVTKKVIEPALVLKEEIIEKLELPPEFGYIEVVDSCGPYHEGACVNVRSAPRKDAPLVDRLRTGAVLRVGDKVGEYGDEWYPIIYDEWLRYPERVSKERYVSARYVTYFSNEGIVELKEGEKYKTTKRIIVDRSDQKLYAYDGKVLYMEETISTGIELTPTPRGSFKVYKKTPTRYMQGPLPGISAKKYDLPGVPWNLYFTNEGAVIHGTFWHDKFGRVWSNGCVNLPPEKAKKLYMWADIGTEVIVRD